MNEHRKIVINIGPQSQGAWLAIALAVFFVSAALALNGFAGCVARDSEARAGIAKAAAEMAKQPSSATWTDATNRPGKDRTR